MSGRRRAQSPEADGSDEWSSSSDDSKYSDSDSSVPEWEADVSEDGALVYVRYEEPPPAAAAAPAAVSAPATAPPPPLLDGRHDFKRSSIRRASKGKIFKVLRNRYRQTKKTDVFANGKKNQENVECSNLAPQTSAEKCLDITIRVDREKYFYSDKGCQLEQMFGISVNKSEDGKSLKVSRILNDARVLYEAKVKPGFRLQKINSQEVTPSNLYTVLENIRSDRQSNTLTFTSVPHEALTIEFKNLLTSKTEHEFVLSQVLRDSQVSVVYISGDGLDESSSDDRGVLYCYPRPYDHNFLYNTRGAFITLNHLTTKGLLINSPLSSTILVKDVLINVVYVQRSDDLMLVAIPNHKLNLWGARMATEDMVQVLEFLFGSLRRCFSERANLYKIDHLFSRFFAMIVCGFDGADTRTTVRMEELVGRDSGGGGRFERVLPLAHLITLPRQVRLQIDDVLSEFEAADYREWTDDLLNCQRLFVVTGCCLFYSGYLLSSHMADTELRDVHSLLRLGGLLQLSRLAPARLLLWREVFVSTPAAADYTAPEMRRFLIVVGKGHFLLAAIMEVGGCTEEAEEHPPPSPFYVEEAESCLELLLELGLDRLLAGWLRANCRPQLQLQPRCAGGGDNAPPVPRGDINKAASLKPGGSSQPQPLLKRRHRSSEQLHACADPPPPPPHAASHHDLYRAWHPRPPQGCSDDSVSQQSASETTEERVAGRRADRERRRDSSGSDSEWEGQGGSRTSGSLDMSEVRRSLLDEVNQLTVHRITAGEENVLLHYVQLESARGVLLAPAGELEGGAGSALYSYILSAFRAAAHKIHALLQNTIRLKESLSPASCINKSLVAVRERGVLLQAPAHLVPRAAPAAAAPSHARHPTDVYQFWVVGRLFSDPEPKELYVCYHEAVPQDVLEVAYRLSFLE